jgi:probable phosphoglycerate mutase
MTHKGVIRAVFALAAGWDMTTAPPSRLRRDCVHIFAVDAEGRPAVERLNAPLAIP